MTQIKQNQVIADDTKPNAYFAFPRDLEVTQTSSEPVKKQTTNIIPPGSTAGDINLPSEPPNPIPGDSEIVYPATPAIVSVDSQTARWSEGRMVVDVVLNIDDMNKGYDFEIRVTKNQGDL